MGKYCKGLISWILGRTGFKSGGYTDLGKVEHAALFDRRVALAIERQRRQRADPMNRRQLFGGAIAAPALIAKTVQAGQSRDRVSRVTGDPGEPLFMQLCGDGKRLRIFLDGVEQKDVVTADPGAGFVRRAVRTPSGNIAFNPSTGDVHEEVVYGVVQWVAVDEPHRLTKARAPTGAIKVVSGV